MKIISTALIILLSSTSAFSENVMSGKTNMNMENAQVSKAKSNTIRVGLLGLTCMFSGGVYTIAGQDGIVSCVSDPSLFHKIGSEAKATGVKKVEIVSHSAGSVGAVEGANILASYNVKAVIAAMDPIVCDMQNKVQAGTKIMRPILSVGWEPCNPASHLMLFTLPPHTTQTLDTNNQMRILQYFKAN